MYQSTSSSSSSSANPTRPALTVDVQSANSRLRSNVQAQRQQEQEQQRAYQLAQEEAANQIMEDDASDQEDGFRATQQQSQGGQQEGDHEEEDVTDDSGSFSDSLSSSPSIPDDDIDFDFVYAFHTFLATVDGQASVVKGDKLMLLDDTNSYWWLIRVLKTQAVGYIPAENIETPQERLARLNKHRNVDLTSIIPADYETGPSSTHAQTRFGGRIPPSRQPHPHKSQHPSAKGFPASPSHKDHPRNFNPEERPERSHSSKAKTVIFTAPIYYEHSANGESDREDESYGDGDYEMEGEEYDGEDDGEGEGEDEEWGVDEEGNRVRIGRRRHHHHHHQQQQLQGDQVFDDDDGDDESEFSDDNTEDQSLLGVGTVGGVVQTVAGAGGKRVIVQHQSHQHEEHRGDRQLTKEEEEEEEENERRWRLQQDQQQKEQQYEYEQQQQQALAHQQRQLYEFQQQQQLQIQQQQQHLQQQQQQLQYQSQSQQPPRSSSAQSSTRRPSNESDLTSSQTGSRRPSGEASFDPDAPTKKLTATPPIVRDPTFDMNNPFGDQGGLPRPSSPLRVRGVEVIDVKDPRYQNLISDRRPGDNLLERSGSSAGMGREENTSMSFDEQGSFVSNPSEEGHGSSSLKSFNSSYDSSIGKKRKPDATGGIGSQSAVIESVNSALVAAGVVEPADKKRKSGGGILSGLFGRKKDKKKKGGEVESDAGSVRDSEDSTRQQQTPTPTPASIAADLNSNINQFNTSPLSSSVTSNNTGLGVGSGVVGVRRESQTAESMFSTDAALRQQELEAKQAMFHQYGVHRGPGDIVNQMTPRNASMSGQTMSPTTGFSPSLGLPPTGQRMRPGSLIGSPSIPGLDVPLLSVLRVFAGDNIDSEATFKTVLLNRSTSSVDLVKQSMQRFRLAGSEDRDEYFLTVKELGGDERPLFDDQKPLVIFEALSDTAGDGFAIPSVKRSSIGSINSVSSNLSLNPAITRLGMNDFSDDSVVKFYLNRRPALDQSIRVLQAADNDSTLLSTPTGPSGLTLEQSTPTNSPSVRFAARLIIHPEDLPDDIVFDPQSLAIVPRALLAERLARSGGSELSESISPNSREKIIFFPRNVNVSEVIEAAVDRFGIVDAIVDGGDEVEDRLSRRRSTMRAKYGLAVIRNGQETPLSSSGKLVDAYLTPPLYKPYDRTSKEFRRRSVDATLILGASNDVQVSDPVFVLRRAPNRSVSGSHRNSLLGLSPSMAGGFSPSLSQSASGGSSTMDESQSTTPTLRRGDRPTLDVQQVSHGLSAARSSTASSAASGESVYQTPVDERTQELLARAASPQATKQEIIAAQRAVSRANQNAILSAQTNSEQGVDIVVPDRGTIRSSRNLANDQIRYSYIDQDGTITDISEIVKAEWTNDKNPGASERSLSSMSRATTDTFHTVAESPTSTIGRSSSRLDDDEEERMAINALRSAPVTIDREKAASPAPAPAPAVRKAPSASSLIQRLRAEGGGASGGDVLQEALGERPQISPRFNESLQERLDRVLAKVREDKANGRISPGLRSRTPQSLSGRVSPGVTGSGRNSPAMTAGDRKTASGRKSPLVGGGRDSPSIDQIIGSPRSAPSSSAHGKKPSITSMNSTQSSGTSGTDQPSTPVTGGSNGNTFTPISSVNSNYRPPVVYRDDFGLSTLLTIIEADSRPRLSATTSPLIGADALFGRSTRSPPDVSRWYEGHSKALDDIESRLDALLVQVVTT